MTTKQTNTVIHISNKVKKNFLKMTGALRNGTNQNWMNRNDKVRPQKDIKGELTQEGTSNKKF